MSSAARLIALLVTIAAAALFARSAEAATRHAFVVGIDNYDNLQPALKKARNDAKAIGDALAKLGYDVSGGPDLDRLTFIERWQTFLDKIKPNDVVAVFYAGHGVQMEGANYLLPRDVPPAVHGPEVLKSFSISAVTMIDALRARKPRISLLIFDACRDNPYKSSASRSISGTRGLAPMERTRGTFIMYSAGADEQALDRLSDDDPQANSVYTRHLLPLLQKPELSILQVAKRVQSEVEDAAATQYVWNGQHIAHPQTPAYYDGISGEYYVSAPDPADDAGPIAKTFEWIGEQFDTRSPAASGAAPSATKPPQAENQTTAAAVAPTATPTAEPADCRQFTAGTRSTVSVAVGSKLCSEGDNRAIIQEITSHSVTYSVDGGTPVTCKSWDICTFSWRGAPKFRVKIRPPQDGAAASADIVPN